MHDTGKWSNTLHVKPYHVAKRFKIRNKIITGEDWNFSINTEKWHLFEFYVFHYRYANVWDRFYKFQTSQFWKTKPSSLLNLSSQKPQSVR